ncbi:MAG TPA: hypothetical protein VGE01_04685 [Fimbriimonas sp.]
MKHLQRLKVAERGPVRPSIVGVDLVDEEGVLVALEASEAEVRKIVDSTCTSMVWLEGESASGPGLAMMGMWPYPFRGNKLLLHAVQPDDVVLLNVRVSLARIPQRVLSGVTAFSVVSPWVQVLGPARDACGPFTIAFPRGARTSELVAGSLALPPSCSLVSQPEQVLFRLEPVLTGTVAAR